MGLFLSGFAPVLFCPVVLGLFFGYFCPMVCGFFVRFWLLAWKLEVLCPVLGPQVRSFFVRFWLLLDSSLGVTDGIRCFCPVLLRHPLKHFGFDFVVSLCGGIQHFAI